jgi:hypothetical protein
MIWSAAGKAAEREGKKESWGAILRLRLVRAVVLWPRVEMSGTTRRAEDGEGEEEMAAAARWRRGATSWDAGRRRERRSIGFVVFLLVLE